ncbi:hypothetical protein OTK51_20905 [Vibrio scophthalmi]|uniref:hypothetical protein n=1 Tax=Vibrio scophthalmi TaxID=45658 RepID=UPI00228378E9|nr:hypothetical protein [Vibrio scophthalmi]MCY9805887.1 hypothetical protein [Vibrio scophthalmi]
MEVVIEKVEQIKGVLRSAAQMNSVVSYGAIFRVFDGYFDLQDAINQASIWHTLEFACEELADPKVAMYGALLSKKNNNGLPGDGFLTSLGQEGALSMMKLHLEVECSQIDFRLSKCNKLRMSKDSEFTSMRLCKCL